MYVLPAIVNLVAPRMVNIQEHNAKKKCARASRKEKTSHMQTQTLPPLIGIYVACKQTEMYHVLLPVLFLTGPPFVIFVLVCVLRYVSSKQNRTLSFL